MQQCTQHFIRHSVCHLNHFNGLRTTDTIHKASSISPTHSFITSYKGLLQALIDAKMVKQKCSAQKLPDLFQIFGCVQVVHIAWFNMKSVIGAKIFIVFIVRQFIIRFYSHSNCCLQQGNKLNFNQQHSSRNIRF